MPNAILRSNQIIVAALTAGAAALLGVALYLRSTNTFSGEGFLISFVAMGASMCGLVARMVVLQVMVSQARFRIREGRFVQPPAAAGSAWAELDQETREFAAVFQAKTIIGAALVEAGALLGGIAYMLEGTTIALGVGVIMTALIATNMPTARGAQEWLDGQRRLMAEEA